MSKAQILYNSIVSEPLPDAFGYQYKDTSLEKVKDILYSTVNESKEKKNISAASLILSENRNLISESFIDKLSSYVSSNVINLVRGSLLNWFNIDIDKDNFHRITNIERIDTRSPEFKDIKKVYLSYVNKNDRSCLVIIHKAKILGIYGDSDVIRKGKDTCSTVLKKAVNTWWVRSGKKDESLVSFSKAQKLLIG